MEEGTWVPTFGPLKKQKSPNQIRKYIAESGINQTEFLRKINVNANSYGRFMNMKYKR